MGVRKRLSEESLRETYRLNGVQTGSVVVRAHDKYFGDFSKGYDLGILVRKTSSTVQIHWMDDEDITSYSQGDARYEVERGRWRFLGIMQGNPLDPKNPLVDALTKLRQNAIMLAGNQLPTPPTEETDSNMAREMSNAAAERAAAQNALKNGELRERETYTAKQVATRCGTDSKTMRKFFRSPHSTIDPVGQGGRYEFDAKDMPKIRQEFTAWRKKAQSRQTKPTPKIDPAQIAEAAKNAADGEFTPAQIADAIVEADVQEMAAAIQDFVDQEPTDEDLAELDEVDLDDLDED